MTDTTQFSEPQPRRQSPRIPGPFEARLAGSTGVAVRVRDLSTAGCFVDGDEDIPVSDDMRLHIDLPGEGWISARTELVYRLGRQGVAMKFVDLDEPTRGRILREIERALTQTGL
jgi:hypothetical protein